MDLNKIFKEKTSVIFFIIINLIIILLIFRLGVFVGQRQADFSYRWSENYHQAFGGPKRGFMQDLSGRDFIAGHGNIGIVIKIENNLIIIKDPENTEKIIETDNQTAILQGRDIMELNQIEIDDRIMVLGAPQDNGKILARLIRIFNLNDPLPPPPPRMNLPYPKFK